MDLTTDDSTKKKNQPLKRGGESRGNNINTVALQIQYLPLHKSSACAKVAVLSHEPKKCMKV